MEISVIAPSNNGLVGNGKLPADKRMTSISLITLKPSTPLLAAVLPGSVSIEAMAP